jgi:predicted nucleic acid-binding Zn ribbon protein
VPTEDPGLTSAVEASTGQDRPDQASPNQASTGQGSPEQGSAPQPGPPRSPAQLAREALARAKADARARGDLPAGGSARPSARGPAGQAGRPRRPRRDDPQPLTMAIRGLIGDQGWQTEAAMGSVFGRWPQIVGADLAAHTRPDRFTDGELLVIADSTAWATQVRLLAGTLVRRLNSELGEGTVTKVKVRGPEQPRRPGEWRVRGGRGPRDTYG